VSPGSDDQTASRQGKSGTSIPLAQCTWHVSLNYGLVLALSSCIVFQDTIVELMPQE